MFKRLRVYLLRYLYHFLEQPRPTRVIALQLLLCALAALSCAVLAELSPLMGTLCLLLSLSVYLILPLAAITFLFALYRRDWAALLPLVLAPLIAAGASWLSARVIFGVPYWVQYIVQDQVGVLKAKYPEGNYPSHRGALPKELRRDLLQQGCFYTPRGGSNFEITCRGIAFTLCTYDFEAASWSTWD